MEYYNIYYDEFLGYLNDPEQSGSISTNTVSPSPIKLASLAVGVEKLAMLGGSL